MKNYIQPGKVITIRNTTVEAKSGDLVTMGDLVGVAVTDAEIGDDLVMQTEGVFYLPKVKADLITPGMYLALKSGKLTKNKSGGRIVAVAVEDATNQMDLIAVKLLPSSLPAEASQS